MIPSIVPAYAAALAFLFVLLSLRVIAGRRLFKVGIGAGGHAPLERRMRVQANFAEYTPLALILLTFIEMQKASLLLVHALCISLLAGRALHAAGVSRDREMLIFRQVGMALTFTVIIVSALLLWAGALGYGTST